MVAMPECGWIPPPELPCRRRVEPVQEHERLDALAQIRGAHDAGDRAVATAPSAGHDAAVFNE